ncbi:MAG: RIP metalloprotease RseP [Terriglobia bacterium]|jgi:regulator of sigma E protease|nr:RIP metalloprotease RseP [Terriglobia bacterium]
MVTFLYDVVSVVIVLGIMIVVHELGHFMAAKMFGVRVETFSIGFGKRLLGFKRGETDYRISALPLGGYVKMSGENPMESRTGDPGEFMSHPRWQRFIIAVAGPFMNILLAVVLLTAVFMVHDEQPVYLNQPAVIGWVLENSPAEKAGLEPGDRIARYNNMENPTWEDVISKVMLSPNSQVSLTIQRGNETLQKTIVPEAVGPDQVGSAGWLPDSPTTVTDVEAGQPAAKVGIKVDDEIVALNGTPIRSTQVMVRMLQQTESKPVELTVVRDGKEMKFTLAPALTDVSGSKKYRIGVATEPAVRIQKLPFPKAFAKSVEQNKRYSVLILDLVKRMVEQKVSIKTMSGPIGIAKISGEAAQQDGWTPIMMVMAAISLNLGIFNLFPIPILDGGLILLLAIEGLIRRDINQTVKERIYQAAFVCLILFAGLVIFNDVVKLLPHRFQ